MFWRDVSQHTPPLLVKDNQNVMSRVPRAEQLHQGAIVLGVVLGALPDSLRQ